jgi:hypothetical protein
MPENHKAYIGMNKESALKWAMDKGENIQLLVERIFGRVTVEQQAYRSIMGLRLLTRLVRLLFSHVSMDAAMWNG